MSTTTQYQGIAQAPQFVNFPLENMTENLQVTQHFLCGMQQIFAVIALQQMSLRQAPALETPKAKEYTDHQKQLETQYYKLMKHILVVCDHMQNVQKGLEEYKSAEKICDQVAAETREEHKEIKTRETEHGKKPTKRLIEKSLVHNIPENWIQKIKQTTLDNETINTIKESLETISTGVVLVSGHNENFLAGKTPMEPRVLVSFKQLQLERARGLMQDTKEEKSQERLASQYIRGVEDAISIEHIEKLDMMQPLENGNTYANIKDIKILNTGKHE